MVPKLWKTLEEREVDPIAGLFKLIFEEDEFIRAKGEPKGETPICWLDVE